MDHAEALERIEIAAVEPRGLERLTAGDTPDAAAVAGHLAGCPACAAELARIRRSSAIVREVVLAEPDPALRERTLAYVRALGRERGRSGDGAPVGSAADGSPVLATLGRPRRRFAWAVGLAAALVVAGALGFAAGGTWLAGQGNRDREVALLQDTTASAMRIAGQPDARAVTLAATTAGAGGGGRLVFSASSGELVMTATGLAPLEAGAEYGCWVEVDGERRRLGRMYWAGNLWAWAGPADGLADLPAGTAFGVSLVAAGGGDGQPVLAGEL
ncbi:MAG: anti-sigma factor [Chloroflexota bacterium]